MKYSLIQCVNGNFTVVSEHGNDKQAALVAFHDRCKILWNAPDAYTAMVKIVDENLDCVDGKMEYITHPVPVEEELEETQLED